MNQVLLLSLFFLFLSCENKSKPDAEIPDNGSSIDSATIVNDPKNNLNIQAAAFSEVDTSGIVMFPLRMGETAREGVNLSYKSMPAGNYWNIIFFNSKTGDYHLLSERKMMIHQYSADYQSDDGRQVSTIADKILYSITVDDKNGDKLLNGDDPTYLFISDKYGNNFRQISPTNGDLQNWKLIKSSGKIIMAIRNDTDGNKKFDDKDEIASYVYDLRQESLPREILSPDFKNKLKVVYDRDWKRVKK